MLELHDAVDERVDREVGAEAHVTARVPLRATLADDDVAGNDLLAAELLHATVLRIAVAAVSRRADALFMCHLKVPLSERDVADADFREALPMTLLLRVILAPLHFEDDDLLVPAVLDDLSGHRRSLERRHADERIVAIRAKNHVAERDLRSRIARKARYSDCLSRLGAELLAAGADNCVSHC